jgi:hypothetical protein
MHGSLFALSNLLLCADLLRPKPDIITTGYPVSLGLVLICQQQQSQYYRLGKDFVTIINL